MTDKVGIYIATMDDTSSHLAKCLTILAGRTAFKQRATCAIVHKIPHPW